MKELVLYNGITEKAWSEIVDDLFNKRSSYVDALVSFMTQFNEGIWLEMHLVWTQTNMTPEMWHNYKLFTDKPLLAEQKQMYELGKKMKSKWRNFKLKTSEKPLKEDPARGPDQATKQEAS